LGIEQTKVENRLGHIAFAIQQFSEARGFSLVKRLNGHGLGKELHEKPEVPNFGKMYEGEKIRSGLVIAIEPMLNVGTEDVYWEKDGWTVSTKDKKKSAHFEHTVVIFESSTEVLTSFELIEKNYNFAK
jgi:methionyl aminopeptidase